MLIRAAPVDFNLVIGKPVSCRNIPTNAIGCPRVAVFVNGFYSWAKIFGEFGETLPKKGSLVVNTDIFQGKWKQIRGEARELWGDLTDDELEQINGSMDKLVGKLQEKYGYTREKAQKEADSFRLKMESKYRQSSDY